MNDPVNADGVRGHVAAAVIAATTPAPTSRIAPVWSTVRPTPNETGLPAPLAESQKITGLACFYDEKADVYLDGELQERPRTQFA